MVLEKWIGSDRADDDPDDDRDEFDRWSVRYQPPEEGGGWRPVDGYEELDLVRVRRSL